MAAGLLVAGVALSFKLGLANSLLGLALLLWVTGLVRGTATWRPSRIYLPLLGYVLVSVASAFASYDPKFSLGNLGELSLFAIVPMTAAMVDRSWWDRFLVAMTVSGVTSSLVGLWQYSHGSSNLAHRLTGLMNHYMTFSGWTLVVVLLLAADAAFHPNRRRLLWTVPSVAVCTAALLLSFTRNAWVGLATGAVLMAAVWRPKAFYAYPVVAILLAVLLPRPVLDRFVSIFDLSQPSNYDRLCMTVSGSEMVQDRPLLGVGPGMVKRRYPLYRAEDAPRWQVPHLHSNVVQIAAERGLLGLAAYLAVLVVFARHTWHALRRRDGPEFAALAGCLLAIAGITVAGLFEYNWADAEVSMITYACLAAPWALAPEGA